MTIEYLHTAIWELVLSVVQLELESDGCNNEDALCGIHVHGRLSSTIDNARFFGCKAGIFIILDNTFRSFMTFQKDPSKSIRIVNFYGFWNLLGLAQVCSTPAH